MKKTFLLGLYFVIISASVFGQSNGLYIGGVVSHHSEASSIMIYGPGLEARNGQTRFIGTGIELNKQFNSKWGMSLGINYVNRHYEMKVPYNHCYFLEPEEACTYILAHVDGFGYKTIEIPIGISRYLVQRNKIGFFLSIAAMPAFDFQSYYNPYIPVSETETIKKINMFSGSIISSAGISYAVAERLLLTAEPFIRVLYLQREDNILIIGQERDWTYFDNFGIQFSMLFRL